MSPAQPSTFNGVPRPEPFGPTRSPRFALRVPRFGLVLALFGVSTSAAPTPQERADELLALVNASYQALTRVQ